MVKTLSLSILQSFYSPIVIYFETACFMCIAHEILAGFVSYHLSISPNLHFTTWRNATDDTDSNETFFLPVPFVLLKKCKFYPTFRNLILEPVRDMFIQPTI